MANPHQAVVVLSRAIDQAGDVLASIHPDEWERPTPCGDWSVRQLAAHLAVAPEHFLQQARGEEVDWSAPADVPDGQWAGLDTATPSPTASPRTSTSPTSSTSPSATSSPTG